MRINGVSDEYQKSIRIVSDLNHNFDQYILLCFTDHLTIFTIEVLFWYKIYTLYTADTHDTALAKQSRGGGHHLKADDKQSLRVEGCQLDCR